MLRAARAASGLSVRGVAEVAEVASSTVHRIEQGRLHPTLDMLERILLATGTRLRLDTHVDHTLNLVGLARSIANDLADADTTTWSVRRAADLVQRFLRSTAADQRRMLRATPPATGDPRWDAFLGALAQWLAGRADVAVPPWATEPDRYLFKGWWVTTLDSMRAWEYAGTPASFQQHGVYVHRESLVNV